MKNDYSVTNQSSVSSIFNSILDYLSHKFPVACASDEFYYFPQVQLPEPEWNKWDHFSLDAIEETVHRLSSWEDELRRLSLKGAGFQLQIDANILQKILRSLREQLAEVRSWEFQPTFYLTIICTGLAESIPSENPAAKHDRAASLPDFLAQAIQNLNNIPVLFRDMGLEMVSDTRNYLISVLKLLPELQSALVALDRFEDALQRVPTRQDFLLQRDLLERVVQFHLHCDMGIEDIGYVLDQEIEEIQRVLVKEARKLVPGQSSLLHSERTWLEALRSIPVPYIGRQEILKLYEEEIGRLARHCLEQGLVSPRLVSACPVSVLPTPEFLSAIRVGASYSIPPKHPPIGGKFYVPVNYSTDESRRASLREYKMTCAHETYPGHHLLDCSRWNLARPLRRYIEQPIFYEGWACFAEELMRLTEYFSEPADRLLLARRRLSHAMRGKVDIGLQTGEMDIQMAATYLEKAGVNRQRAKLSARKYPLNPGYQLCYTIGLRRLVELWHGYDGNDLPKFVKTILNQGQILFTDLEKLLQGYE